MAVYSCKQEMIYIMVIGKTYKIKVTSLPSIIVGIVCIIYKHIWIEDPYLGKPLADSLNFVSHILIAYTYNTIYATSIKPVAYSIFVCSMS
jgi:hypothetical protein